MELNNESTVITFNFRAVRSIHGNFYSHLSHLVCLNAGEVIATPILSYLKGTPNEWMQQLVLALHKGDIDNFNLIVDNYKTQYFAQPALASKHEDVKKKIVLLCLLNIAFEKPSYDRRISFTEIANKTRIPIDQVIDDEFLLLMLHCHRLKS